MQDGINEAEDAGSERRSGISPSTNPPGIGILIPPDQLAPETLRAVIEEFVTRDGTDLVEGKTKITQVEALLERGEVGIWFDEATRSCNILPT